MLTPSPSAAPATATQAVNGIRALQSPAPFDAGHVMGLGREGPTGEHRGEIKGENKIKAAKSRVMEQQLRCSGARMGPPPFPHGPSLQGAEYLGAWLDAVKLGG